MHQIGDYEVLRRLAAGGMGTVYLARRRGHEGFSRLVALKQLHPQFELSEEGAERFAAEARIGGQFAHPNIVAVLAFERDGPDLIIVLEYVHGLDLGALLAAHGGPLPEPLAAHVAREVLSGLDAAHRHCGDDGRPSPIIHRDLTPSNVLVSQAGEVKITDFGIARIAGSQVPRSQGLRGTVGYMSPEHASGQTVDARSDVYAAALLLYEMLVGRSAYDGDDELAILAAAQRGEAVERPLPGVSDELAAVVRRALQPEPDARHADARECRDALDALLERWGRPTREQVAALVEGHVEPVSSLRVSEPRVTRVAGAPAADKKSRAPTVALARSGATLESGIADKRRWLVVGVLAVAGVLALALMWVLLPSRGGHQPAGVADATTADATTADAEAEGGVEEKLDAATPARPEAAPPDAGPAPQSELVRVRPRRGHGVLVLNTVPSWSRVSIGGRPRGTTPLRVRLVAGRHRLVIWPLGKGPPRRLTVTIRAGQETKQILRIAP